MKVCKSCGFKGEDKDFLQGGIYICPKCSSMNIKIEKPGVPEPPKPAPETKAKALEPGKDMPDVKVKALGEIPIGKVGTKPLSEFKPDNPPGLAPSGKPAAAYGEILVRVWLTGPKDDPASSAEAAILGPGNMPFPFWMIGCEHLMTLTAQKSKAGFEKALELLAEGAMTNRGKVLKK